jgi:hypothetical protein
MTPAEASLKGVDRLSAIKDGPISDFFLKGGRLLDPPRSSVYSMMAAVFELSMQMRIWRD